MNSDLVGQTLPSNNCGDFTVIEVKKGGKLLIRFHDTSSERVVTTYFALRGRVRDKGKPSLYGVGCIGYGEYTTKIDGKPTPCYNAWSNMLERCYSPKYHSKHRYENTTVCEEWLNFQNFSVWFEHRYSEGLCIDKDILNNKGDLYSPETCALVPVAVNNLLTFRDSKRGNYSCGVVVGSGRENTPRPFQVSLSGGEGSKNLYLGSYSTEEEAFGVYKVAKESKIKEVALLHWTAGNITKEVYEALIVYQVLPHPEKVRILDRSN